MNLIKLNFWENRASLVVQVIQIRPTLSTVLRQFKIVSSLLLKEGLIDKSRARLLEAFDDVNKHFKDLFKQLFGGGEAYLKLEGSDDPLESGLELMASPPGKKLQQLNLLSGGEKAITALALIFSVFLTKPSPICILDEVDAPLDDSNVDRFCDLLDKIINKCNTRFLIITHHRLTMARMDRLYGITMNEPGVSQLVSVSLKEAEFIKAAE